MSFTLLLCSNLFYSMVMCACLELPVQGGDEEADELVVRVRRAVRHERLQEVVDVVVAPCTTSTHPVNAFAQLMSSNQTASHSPSPIWNNAALTTASAASLPILATIAFLTISKHDICSSNDRY